MNINDRIKELIRLLTNNKQNIFADVTGIKPSTLNGIVGTRESDISFNTLRKILDAYPVVSVQWLLYGIGEPIVNQKKNNTETPQKEDKADINKKDTEISERVSLIIERLSPSPNSFAADLGYAKSQTIYDVINGKSAPSNDFFRRFMLSEYSGIISINWLLTGRGKMIIDSESENNLEPEENPTELAVLKMLRKVISDNALLESKLEKQENKKKQA
ncbi:MAG: helix-turn-helix transcriptional regulator [Prolixibacteraceae bacterium]